MTLIKENSRFWNKVLMYLEIMRNNKTLRVKYNTLTSQSLHIFVSNPTDPKIFSSRLRPTSLLVTTIHLKWTPSYLDSLWPFRLQQRARWWKLPFSFFVLIFSRRWHTAMNPTSRTRGREELHRLRHPVPSPHQFQPRRQVKNPMLPPSTKSKCSLKSSVDVIWSCAVLLPTKKWSRCGECGNM